MQLTLSLAILLYVVNSILLTILAAIYGRTSLRTRAAYPVGLFFFATLLLVHSAGTAIGYFVNAPYFGDEALPFMSTVGVFELAGLLFFVKTTL